jgi:hypothetical protein
VFHDLVIILTLFLSISAHWSKLDNTHLQFSLSSCANNHWTVLDWSMAHSLIFSSNGQTWISCFSNSESSVISHYIKQTSCQFISTGQKASRIFQLIFILLWNNGSTKNSCLAHWCFS